jgi:purine-binding chemotaxis protein CheW
MPEPGVFSAAASTAPKTQVLLIKAASRCWALPLGSVVETMRPLPVREVPGMPAFLRGHAVIRGHLTPVVDLTMLATGAAAPAARRYVTMRLQPHHPPAVADVMVLAVDDVLSVRECDATALAATPALLSFVAPELRAEMVAFDRRLVPLLQAVGQAAADAVPVNAQVGLRARGRDA